MEYNEVDSSLHAPSCSITSSRPSDSGLRSETRLIQIFEKEIDREIAERMGTIGEIADKIKICQQSLDRLRKEAVTKYYMGSCQEMECEEQPSIHPAVKKLIGKRPRNISQTERFMTANHNEWKREMRRKLLKSSSYKYKSHSDLKVKESMRNDSIIKPKYIPPTIPGNPQENSSLRGNTKKMHMRVLIGNVAKQILPDGDIFDPATHKWMVYVRSAPGSLSVDREVSRVNFFLHPSYKPHDIITVPSPPFTLNRRGWGEFPMRVQLHFKNRLNKPADIIHHLKLNGAISGHHTRSAETFADLWIYPHERGQENLSKDRSEDILWLASDMLKEEVPDFTAEVICSKCQTTSLGTDSYSCTCNAKLHAQDSSPNNTTDESGASSSESDSSDSEDSAEDSLLPKPIPCWEISSDSDIETVKTILKEEIKEEVSDKECNSFNATGFAGETVNFTLDVKKNEKLKNENDSVKKDCVSVANVKEFESDLAKFSPFNLAKAGSDFLQVDASDIMDALEMKQEVKEEPQENVICNETVETNQSGCNNSTERDTDSSKLSEEMDVNLGRMEFDSDKLDNKTTFKNDNSSSSIQMITDSNIDCKVQNNNLLTVNANLSNSPSDIDMIIEEVPIDDFINNIVEEEVIVEVPEVADADFTPNGKSEKTPDDPDAHHDTSQGTNKPSAEAKSQMEVTGSTSCSKVTVNNLQSNSVPGKLKETSQSKTLCIPPITTHTEQKNIIAQKELQTVKQSLKVTPKYVKLQPVQKLSKSSEELVNGQKYPSVNKPIKVNINGREAIVKSPRIIKIPKELLLNKQVILSTDPVLKKYKIEIPNQDFNSNQRNLMVGQGAILLKSSKINSLQIQSQGEKINSNSVISNNNSMISNTSTKSVFESSEMLKANSQNTSLLKPQFRSNTVSKSSIRNPNSLLKPVSTKLVTNQSNAINQQMTTNQVLSGSRPMTYSVLKTTVKGASAQSAIEISKSNSWTSSGLQQTKTTQNPITSVKTQPNTLTIQQVQRPLVSSKFSNVKKSTASEVPTVQNSSGLAEKIQPKTATVQNVHSSTIISSANQMNTQSSKDLNRDEVTLKNSISQEILRLSNTIYAKDVDCKLEVENCQSENLQVSCSGSHDSLPVKCSAPKSFDRQMFTSVSKPFVSNAQRKNESVKSQILQEKEINLNFTKGVTDTISFNELIKVIHFPKTNLPSRPVIISSGASEKREVRKVEMDFVLSCNSLHNSLQQRIPMLSESQFGKKSVMINKDQVNAAVNEQIHFYLEQMRLLVNTCWFSETELAVRWLVRGLPLVHQDARLAAYKTVHPYCAVSREAYCSWPPFKQAAAEWLRAKTVVRLLSALHSKGVLSEEVWTTRTVYWWCRTHGYSPAFCLIGPQNSANNEDWIQKVEQKTSPTKVLEWMASVRHEVRSSSEEEVVDVVGIEPQEVAPGRSGEGEESCLAGAGSLICGKPWVRDIHSYVVNKVEGLGQEPLVAGGPPQSAASTVLAHAAVAFTEDLLRRGLANAARRGGGSLEPRDVCRAILRRPEFDMFTGEGLNEDTALAEHLQSLQSCKPP